MRPQSKTGCRGDNSGNPPLTLVVGLPNGGGEKVNGTGIVCDAVG